MDDDLVDCPSLQTLPRKSPILREHKRKPTKRYSTYGRRKGCIRIRIRWCWIVDGRSCTRTRIQDRQHKRAESEKHALRQKNNTIPRRFLLMMGDKELFSY